MKTKSEESKVSPSKKSKRQKESSKSRRKSH